ncbi:type II toxin-antitoxin system ParD family antitoxin [Rhodopseudomonas palustris]|uniref:Putative transcriptional regulators, CopG/Arc/MetJ DNA-binding domain n=1 Tax=Rhodopseudomonas palustris (strain BisB18) TaxID=316056 RepID=Q216B7_RHOPB
MNMNVSLTDELGEFVKSRVSSGRYTSASEVVREALRLMERHEQTEAAKLQWLQQAYREGSASGDAGEIDFAAVKAEARASMSEKAK